MAWQRRRCRFAAAVRVILGNAPIKPCKESGRDRRGGGARARRRGRCNAGTRLAHSARHRRPRRPGRCAPETRCLKIPPPALTRPELRSPLCFPPILPVRQLCGSRVCGKCRSAVRQNQKFRPPVRQSDRQTLRELSTAPPPARSTDPPPPAPTIPLDTSASDLANAAPNSSGADR